MLHKRGIKKNKINTREVLKFYLKIIKPHKKVVLIIILMIFILELTNIAQKYMLKELIDKGTEFSLGTLTFNTFKNNLFILALIFIITVIIKSIIAWYQLHSMIKIYEQINYETKRKIFNHVLHLDYNFHTTNKTGTLISRLIKGNKGIQELSDFFTVNIFPLTFQLIITISLISYFDILSALTLIITMIFLISYSLYILNKQQKLRIIALEAEDKEKGNISDVFTNIDSIKYFGKEDKIKNIFNKLINDTKNKHIGKLNYYRWMDAGKNLILGIGLFIILYFPMNKFLAGDMEIGTVVLIYTAFLSISEPVEEFIYGLRRYYESLANIESILKYYRIKNSIKDKPNAKNLKVKKGKIEFNNVEFSYKRRKIIENLNLKINPGEKIALIGYSGSGKTTIIRLLYRFYDVNKGEIKIDGKNIKDVKLKSLRKELSIVPQETILFDDNIYNNIAFSNPSATKQEIIKAIKFAQLDEFIKKLPQKEKTIVGERGVKLSGGEKQRISIARAIIANKKILILDEATSSLDSKIEFEIQKDLEKLMKGRTSIIIAHRLSTIMKADKIVVLNKGKIIEVGNHKDLMNKKGIYKKLWNLQNNGYIK